MNLRYILPVFITIVMASCSQPSVADEETLFENETTSKVVVELSAQEQTLLDMVNDYRISKGLGSLEFSAVSYQFALEHNEYMISKGELSHDNFNSRASDVSKATSANFVAENVAKNYIVLENALNGWLNSEPHKNTIEGDFTHTTLSIKQDSQGNPYYTQIFFRK